MKSLLLMTLLAAVSLATSACTVSYDRGYGYSSYSGSYYSPTTYARPYYNRCEPRDVYIAGPQYYRTNIPYFHGNMKNYTGTPIIAPNACNPTTNMIIPNSWN